ncbi:MAG: hypothetical protein D6797_04215 [Bdellovibrio sp.]|nr:MAG: hypothetical protein D6797_04215 [Bdellovibrio sp.]
MKKMSAIKNFITLSLLLGGLLFYFNNCSEVSFSKKENGTLNSILKTPSPPQNETEPTPDPITPPPKILNLCQTKALKITKVFVRFPNPSKDYLNNRSACDWNNVDLSPHDLKKGLGNLPPHNLYFQARREQKATFSLPEGSKVCNIDFKFYNQSMKFDDHFIFTFDNVVLATSDNEFIISPQGKTLEAPEGKIVNLPNGETAIQTPEKLTFFKMLPDNPQEFGVKLMDLVGRFIKIPEGTFVKAPKGEIVNINYNQFPRQNGFPIYDWRTIKGHYWINNDYEKYDFCLGQDQGLSDCYWPETESNGEMFMKFDSSIFMGIMGLNEQRHQHEFKFIVTGDDNPSVDCSHSDIQFISTVYYVLPSSN